MRITASGEILGATISGLDLARPLAANDCQLLLQALGRYGVLHFPEQTLSAAQQKAFAARFGSLEINVANATKNEAHPEVMTLSNIVENGRPIGLADAGQDWHTDMSYSKTIALTSILHALKIPRDEQDRPLGATRFANMHAAYDDLSAALKEQLADATAIHDFNKFWEMMRRRKDSRRPPLTDEQRRARPPVGHPMFMTHPISGCKVLYANPGYTVAISGMAPAESDELLAFLFAHQLQAKYIYEHRWNEGDVIMWDNIGTLHYAVADYGVHQPRRMQRCQVMADRVFQRPLHSFETAPAE